MLSNAFVLADDTDITVLSGAVVAVVQLVRDEEARLRRTERSED